MVPRAEPSPLRAALQYGWPHADLLPARWHLPSPADALTPPARDDKVTSTSGTPLWKSIRHAARDLLKASALSLGVLFSQRRCVRSAARDNTEAGLRLSGRSRQAAGGGYLQWLSRHQPAQGRLYAGRLGHHHGDEAERRRARAGGRLADRAGLPDQNLSGTPAACRRDPPRSGAGQHQIVGCADERLAPPRSARRQRRFDLVDRPALQQIGACRSEDWSH